MPRGRHGSMSDGPRGTDPVVLHTNILVSALLSPLGPPGRGFLMTNGESRQMDCDVSGSRFISQRLAAQYNFSQPSQRSSAKCAILDEVGEVVPRSRPLVTDLTVWVRREILRACRDKDFGELNAVHLPRKVQEEQATLLRVALPCLCM